MFNQFDKNVRQIAGATGTGDIFFTVPTDGVNTWNLLFDQVIGTAVLMIFIMALGNVRTYSCYIGAFHIVYNRILII